MGYPLSRYHCTRCAFEQGGERLWTGRRYVLAPDNELPARTKLGWCVTCDRVRVVEDLSLETRYRLLRLFSDALCSVEVKRGWFASRWTAISAHWLDGRMTTAFTAESAHQIGRELNGIQRELAYLGARRHLPRCLTCTETAILEIREMTESGAERLVHPNCGGELVYELRGLINMSPPPVQLLDRDGRFVGERAFAASVTQDE